MIVENKDFKNRKQITMSIFFKKKKGNLESNGFLKNNAGQSSGLAES